MKYIALDGKVEIKAGDFLLRNKQPLGFNDSYIDKTVYFAVYQKGDQLGINTVKRFDEYAENPYFETEPRFLTLENAFRVIDEGATEIVLDCSIINLPDSLPEFLVMYLEAYRKSLCSLNQAMDNEKQICINDFKRIIKKLNQGGHNWHAVCSELDEIKPNFEDSLEKSLELRNITVLYLFLSDIYKKYYNASSFQLPEPEIFGQAAQRALDQQIEIKEAVIQDGVEITDIGLKKKTIRLISKSKKLQPGEVYRFPVHVNVEKNTK